MSVNLMDLYKDDSESNNNEESNSQTQSEEPIVKQEPISQTETEHGESMVSTVDSSVTKTESKIDTPKLELSDEEKKEYGVKTMPTKIEVEDLEKKSDFLKDPSLEHEIPEDLEYSSVFQNKTIINYTLAISGFALLVVGVFSFLNSQNINIQSSLDVISETGKGSLADSGPPSMDLGGMLGLLDDETQGSEGSSEQQATASEQTNDTTVTEEDDIILELDDENLVVEDMQVDDVVLDGNTEDSSVEDDFVDLFGSPGSNNSGLIGNSGSNGSNTDNSGLFGNTNTNPNDSDLNALLGNNDIQLDLLDDDSNVNNRGFLSNTNNTIITSGNIAGDSGPEIYMVLFISLVFAGYLTKRTT